jgi:hypothetical protein
MAIATAGSPSGLLALGGRRYPAPVLEDSDHWALVTRAELDAFVEMLRG